MPNCKECSAECTVRESSQKAKNPGKEYWACPNRCKCWNGWVEDDRVVDSDDSGETGSGIFCKSCQTECVARESKTAKNFGKKFWSCPKRCKVWNGWIEAVETVDSSKPTKPAKPAKPAQNKRKAPDSTGPTKTDTSSKSLPKKPMFSHYCVRCDKELDFDHEIQNNLKRYKSGTTAKYMNPVMQLSVANELRDAMTSGDYTCEACLGNE